MTQLADNRRHYLINFSPTDDWYYERITYAIFYPQIGGSHVRQCHDSPFDRLFIETLRSLTAVANSTTTKRNGNQFLCAVSALLIRDVFFFINRTRLQTIKRVPLIVESMEREHLFYRCVRQRPSLISFYVENVNFPNCDSSTRRILLCILCLCV